MTLLVILEMTPLLIPLVMLLVILIHDERGNSADQELEDIPPSGAGSSKDTPSSSRSGTPMAPQQRKRK